MKSYPAIGIRPIIDARRLGIRDELEGKTRAMAEAAKKLFEENKHKIEYYIEDWLTYKKEKLMTVEEAVYYKYLLFLHNDLG